MPPHIVATRIVYEGFTRLVSVTLRLDEGETVEREVVDHGRAVAVLPYDPRRRTALMVRVLRPPALYQAGKPRLLEAIAGRVEEEDPAAAVRREALEEAGLRIGHLEPAGSVWPSPGILAEKIDLFLTEYSEADRVGAGGGVEGEHEGISVIEVPLTELARMQERNEIDDMKTLALALTLRLRRPDLFAAPTLAAQRSA